ncbi:MAG: SpoIIE family protein phosphatase [Gemmatimonadetes bacterium]|nr:SpoIIE family protein phosphatase [Gemmatimonadota bacterium]
MTPAPDATPATLDFELANDLHAIEHVVESVLEQGRRRGFDADRLRLNLRVGLTEAIANAMLYGNAGDPAKRVRIEVRFDGMDVRILVTDQGEGFDPAAVPDPTLPDNLTRPNGRGIFLIRKLMDHVEFNERGNSILMVLSSTGWAASIAGDAYTGTAGHDAGDAAASRAFVPPRLARVLLDWFNRMHDGARAHLIEPASPGPGGRAARVDALTRPEPDPTDAEPDAWTSYRIGMGDGSALVLRMRAGACHPAEAETLVDALRDALAHDREARTTAAELSERYEEISLLYSINEIVGSVLAMDDATRRILAEVIDVLGARRASLWVHRPGSRTLELAAAVGEGGMRGPIPVDDASSATAWVFRENQTLNIERRDTTSDAVRLEPVPRTGDAFLSVPINFTPPDGKARSIGVLTLVGRQSGTRFGPGEERLLAAVASQIGAALETQRLVQETLRQERLLRELELAHDLQLKLLPDPGTFEGPPQIAARCTPAESVGGDFYQLYRLPGERLGILIGDVSSHGFSAALIMALTLSAVGIYARSTDSPAEVLRHVHRALIRELEQTEMYLSLFYCVLDRHDGLLSYANAGHPQAWRIDGDGQPTRLSATGPPLGTIPVEPYGERIARWVSGRDMLLLFTDGLSDALADQRGSQSGETALVERVVGIREQPLDRIVRNIFDASEPRTSGLPPDDRTMLLVRG